MGQRPFDTGRSLTGFQWLLKRDFDLVLKIGALWAVASAVAVTATQAAYGDDTGLLSFNHFVSPFFISALTHAAVSEDRFSFRDAMQAGWSRYFSFVLLIIIIRILVYAGIMALVLPGVAIGILVCCAAPILAWEEPNPFRALLASFRMIWPRFWRVAGAYLAIMGTAFLLIGIAYMTGLVDGVAGSGPNKVVVSAIVAAVLHVLSVYLGVSIYLEAKYSDGAGDSTLH